jgi:hypothetical protein
MPVSSSEPASGLQDALDARPHLLRRHEIALVARCDASLYRCGETRIVVEKAGDGLPGEVIDVAALACRERSESGFLFGRKINNHASRSSRRALGGQGKSLLP